MGKQRRKKEILKKQTKVGDDYQKEGGKWVGTSRVGTTDTGDKGPFKRKRITKTRGNTKIIKDKNIIVYQDREKESDGSYKPLNKEASFAKNVGARLRGSFSGHKSKNIEYSKPDEKGKITKTITKRKHTEAGVYEQKVKKKKLGKFLSKLAAKKAEKAEQEKKDKGPKNRSEKKESDRRKKQYDQYGNPKRNWPLEQ